MDKFLSKYHCGFGKGYNAQHCLLVMIEKWNKAVDNGSIFGALLMDLSKAIDQGIIQKKSASSSQMLPFVIFDKKVPFLPKVVLF